jgi:tryptophan-rich sensory protein
MTTSKKIAGLVGWILICSLAGIFGAQFEPGQWYALLQKPAWTPPNWVFPVVWPVLYVMMGISVWLLWKIRSSSIFQKEFRWFYLQLVLNGLWSWLFFGAHYIGIALVEIIMLLVAIAVTIRMFWKQQPIAGILLIPYFVWVSYATALTFAIWQLN